MPAGLSRTGPPPDPDLPGETRACSPEAGLRECARGSLRHARLPDQKEDPNRSAKSFALEGLHGVPHTPSARGCKRRRTLRLVSNAESRVPDSRPICSSARSPGSGPTTRGPEDLDKMVDDLGVRIAPSA
jgi:hypothetical protein